MAYPSDDLTRSRISELVKASHEQKFTSPQLTEAKDRLSENPQLSIEEIVQQVKYYFSSK